MKEKKGSLFPPRKEGFPEEKSRSMIRKGLDRPHREKFHAGGRFHARLSGKS
jgi:hypothetical protein